MSFGYRDPSDNSFAIGGMVGVDRRQYAQVQQQPPPSMQRHERLRQAANVLDEQLSRDKYPDLHDLLSRTREDTRDPRVAQQRFLRSGQAIPLPKFVFDEWGQLQARAFMGLFPEIERAWVTMDSRLYLWDYNEADPLSQRAFTVFQDQEQLITAVGVAKALPGVFVEQIDHVLVMATPLEIVVLGLAFERRGDVLSPVSIFKTPTVVPSDNEKMVQIVGTEEGRIFMRSETGQLFELRYQRQEGFFTRKTRLVNYSASALQMFTPTFLNFGPEDAIQLIAVDKPRKLLYTVNQNNDIQLIYLGRDGKSFHRLKKFDDAISRAFNSRDDGVFIRAIYPVSPAESNKIQMVAITSHCDRIFFAINNSYQQYTSQPMGPMEPNTLDLLCVLPAHQRIGSPITVHESFYSKGTLLAVNALSEDTDRVYGLAPNSGAIAQETFKIWMDAIAFEDRQGKVNQIEEIPIKSTRNLPLLGKPDEPGTILNDLATQLEYPPRTYRTLTNQGIWTVTKLRPIDQLCELITSVDQPSAGGIDEFASTYGPAESCAMCLAVACRHPSASQAIRDRAASNQANVMHTASRLFDDLGGSPSVIQTQNIQTIGGGYDGQFGYALPTAEIRYSGRHDGLALYLARLVKPVWKNCVVVAPKGTPMSNFDSHSLSSVLTNLSALNDFLEHRNGFTDLPTPEGRPGTIEGDAWRAEQESLHNIHELLRLCRETIAFLLLLIDNNLAVLVKRMPSEQQKALESMTYEDLITSPQGLGVMRALMAAYIDKQISEDRSMDVVGDELQVACPSICRRNDVILYKGIECTQAAKNQPSKDMQHERLREALGLFKRVLNDIPLTKLQEITEHLKDLDYYDGIVDLVLRWAAAQDPNDFGDGRVPQPVNGYAEGMVPQPENRESGLAKRVRAYEIIFNTIQSLENMQRQLQGVISKKYGPEEIDFLITRVISKALSYDDRLFHEKLYDWFIAQNMTDQLLNIPAKLTPYLEDYLKRESSDSNKTLLLARYYVQNERFGDAAMVYRRLANTPGLDFPTRRGHLIAALVQAKTSLNAEKMLMQPRSELELIIEESEVAEVQAEVLQALERNRPDAITEDELQQLNQRFMDISELWNRYARPFELYEVQLHALQVSETGGAPRQHAEKVWTKLIRRTREDAINHNRNVFPALKEKVREIGLRFSRDENIFPISFLINKLEEVCWQESQQGRQDAGRGWVVHTLRAVSVQYSPMFRAYNEMFDAKLPPWSSPQALTFLLEDISVLIDEWLRDRHVEPVSTQELDDAIQKYLVTVHDSEARDLVGRLQLLAHKVREF